MRVVQLGLELRARRHLLHHTRVDQLIEQQREGGDLVGQELRVRTELDETFARVSALSLSSAR